MWATIRERAGVGAGARKPRSASLAVVAILLGVPLVVGVVVAAVLQRWPAIDPASPFVASHGVGEELRRVSALRTFLRARVDPATATGLALSVAVVAAAAGAAGLGVVLVMVREHTGLAHVDRAAALWGARHATDLSTFALKLVTQFGSTPVIVPLALAVGVLEYRRLPSRALPGFLALAVVGQNVLSNLVKLLVDRARPDIHPLMAAAGTSFPSGHTTTAAACYAAFALLLGRRRAATARSLLAGGAAAIALAVAASRVLLGVHWTTDVVAGLALGWGWAALCSIAFGGRLLHFGAPVEVAERREASAMPAPPRAGPAKEPTDPG